MKADIDFYRNIVENLIPLHQLLGIKLLDVKSGFAKLLIPFRPELIGNPITQTLHGGIISTAMDAVGGVVGMTTLVSTEDKLSTIDIRIDYLNPGKAKDFITEGKLVRSGNRIIVASMIAYQDKGELIAEGKGVYNVKRTTDN